ncbi:MAG TPA: type II toxin-antitoxin system Phd/YefM family antitoxin [Caulobacteraceae bacterium]|nr:type II toxin-antitoxin system Phd/YefM family antitoxin [Caulobacteraceae bacterium]
MSIATLSSRELNQDVSKAKRLADCGPVVVTDRGRPAYVLLSYEEYRRLVGWQTTAAEAFSGPGDFEFEPPRLSDRIFEPAVFEE